MATGDRAAGLRLVPVVVQELAYRAAREPGGGTAAAAGSGDGPTAPAPLALLPRRPGQAAAPVAEPLAGVFRRAGVRPAGSTRRLTLREAAGARTLALVLDAPAGDALAAALLGLAPARPATHDLPPAFLAAGALRVRRVALTALGLAGVRATITLGRADAHDAGAAAAAAVVDVDGRPGDALNLAVRTGAPVVAAAGLLLPPGDRLVVVGGPPGRRLDVRLLPGPAPAAGPGAPGGPTVVLENGLGSRMGWWRRVPAAVAAFAPVVAYDRAGLGRSGPAPLPRTARDTTDDLRALLAALAADPSAGVAPPYVLVGHSYGGLAARLYAARFPGEVAGLVLVDPAHEDSWLARLRPRLDAAAFAPVARDLEQEQRGDPIEGLDYWMDEGIDLDASRALVRAAPPGRPLPVALLTAGRLALPRDWPPEAVEAVRRLRAELAADLLRRLPGSTHTVAAESGHFVQLDQPELVVDAIRAVVGAARRRQVGD
jgi:pimeloyl-ACP methyl ester carboxylesterase/bifunctional DNase/RNase